MTRLSDRAVQECAAEIAYRREIRRGRIVIAGAAALASLAAAVFVWIAPTVRPCAYAVFNPALRGKSFVCPTDPGLDIVPDVGG